MADAVRIEGLADLRRDLRRMEQAGESREVTRALKEGSVVVAAKGVVLAPKGTRPIPASRRPHVRLAASLRPSASGNSAFVRTRLPYGFKAESRTQFLSRALEQSQDQIVEKVGDAIDELAARSGWR